jgi:hypothetical protein
MSHPSILVFVVAEFSHWRERIARALAAQPELALIGTAPRLPERFDGACWPEALVWVIDIVTVIEPPQRQEFQHIARLLPVVVVGTLFHELPQSVAAQIGAAYLPMSRATLDLTTVITRLVAKRWDQAGPMADSRQGPTPW